MSKKTVGIVSFVFGIIIFLAGIIATGVILTMAPSTLKESAQLKKPSEKGFDAFADTRHKDATPLYYDYTFYHLNNAEAIATAADSAEAPAPDVTPKGPYVYREYCQRHDVKFYDDDNEVEYRELCYKVFQPELSKDAVTGEQLSESDVITIPYTAFYGAVSSNGGSANPSVFLIGALRSVMRGLFAAFLTSNAAFTEEYFVNQWASTTAPVSPSVPVRTMALAGGKQLNFDFELSALPDPFFGLDANTITADEATRRDIGTKFLFGTKGIFGAANCPISATTSIPCGGYFLARAKAFGTAVATSDFTTANTIADEFINTYGFPTGADLATKLDTVGKHVKYFSAYIQYITGYYFGQAFNDVGAYAGSDATKAYSMTDSHFFTQRSVRKHLFSILHDPFALLLNKQASGSLFSFGECPNTFQAFGEDATADFDVAACYIEWQSTASYNYIYAQRTGRHDINEVEEAVKWRSFTDIPKQTAAGDGFWCKDTAPVVGRRNPNSPPASNHLTKWEMNPVVNKEFTLSVWNPDTLREVTFGYYTDSKVRGVDTLRFVVKPENIDPEAAQQRNGNLFEINSYGVFDMTCPKGTSIMLTFPNYLHSSYLTRDDVILATGGFREPDFDADSVILDVEPLTGKTINAKFQLMINLEVPTGVNGMTGKKVDVSASDTTAKKVIFPLVLMNKHSTLSAKDADTLKAVDTALNKAPKPVLIVACIFGPLFVALGIYLIVTASNAGAVGSSTNADVELQSKGEVSSSASAFNSGSASPGHVLILERA